MERNADWLKKLDPRKVKTEEDSRKLFFAWKEVMATGKAAELFNSERKAVPRRQAACNRKFAHAFDDKVTPIPAAAQTRQRLTFHAVKSAVANRADSQSLYDALRNMRPGSERGLVSVEWRRLFPKAPKWSPARYWKAPVVVLGHARLKPRKWGEVRWRGGAFSLELRVQERRLFPKAPKWSPVHDWSLPALRLVPQSASSKASARLAQSKHKQSSSKDKDQSQSQSQ